MGTYLKTLLKRRISLVPREFSYRKYKPKRVLFDHLPKCAGTVISDYLIMHYPERVIFKTDVRRPQHSVQQFQSMSEHLRYNFYLITGHLTHRLLDFVHPETITMTVFRDPVDRLISHYYHVRRDRKHYLHDQVMGSNLSLEDYISSGLSGELRNLYTTHFTGCSIKEVEMAPEESVQRAFLEITTKYDFIGFQDNLLPMINRLRNTAHLHLLFHNRPQNKTRNKPKYEDIDEKVKNSIAKVNFLDVKLYAILKESEDKFISAIR